jgi:RNA polymerase sigma-70 factor, ECF subfamily
MSDGAAGFDDEVFLEAYEELRRLASSLRTRHDLPTLNPTALVHEAYIKLAGSKRFKAQSAEHLKFTVVKAMKFVLLDAARKKATDSRGGGRTRVDLDAVAVADVAVDPAAVLAVNEGLEALARNNERQARAFELQFFGGLAIGEIAALLDVSEKTVQRLLRFARASLALSLSNVAAGGNGAS